MAGRQSMKTKARVKENAATASSWLQPRRWIELVLLAWAIAVGVYYYDELGFIDLAGELVSRLG